VRPTRFSFRRTAVVAAAAALVAGGLATPDPAQAAPALVPAEFVAANAAAEVAAQLGDHQAAGTYLDQITGEMVVNITDPADAAAVRAAGATPRVVTRSTAELERVTTALDSSATSISGTTWSVDPVTNQVLVTADTTVSVADLDRIETITDRFAGSARIERTPGELTTLVMGGDAIFTGGARCSLGFNTLSGSNTPYFITAGHCTNIGSTWTASGGALIGTRVISSFPGNDYGVVRYTTSISRPGTVNLYPGSRDITGSGNVFVGQSVQRSGSTTGLHSGTVTATSATVNYPQGTVFNLIRTSVCAEPGDSGGALFSGSTALGLTSGGSGNCTFGGTTFFEDVPEVLSVGLRVY